MKVSGAFRAAVHRRMPLSLPRSSHHLCQTRGGVSEKARHPADLADLVTRRCGYQLAPCGDRIGCDVRFGFAGLVLHRPGHEVCRCHPVGQRVVHLAHDGDAVRLKAFDEMEFPQRAVAVQRSARDLADHLVEAAPATVPRRLYPPQVVVEIELAVLPPHRVVKFPGDVDKSVAQRLQQRQTLSNLLTEYFERETRRAAVDDRGLHGVAVYGRGLAVKQHRVVAAQALHDS